VTCARSRLGEFTAVIDLRPFTHIPSNVLLILVPLMPTLPLAVLVLLRFRAVSRLIYGLALHRHSRVLSPSASPAQRAGYDVAGIQRPYQDTSSTIDLDARYATQALGHDVGIDRVIS
jgi:hypothetical protein